MKLNTKEIISIVLFIALLAAWGVVQSGLKSMPQIVLILVGLCTLGLSFLKDKNIFKIPFFIIFEIVLLSSTIGIADKIMDYFDPNAGLVEVDGEMMGTNGNPNIFYEIFFSIIISIVMLVLYWRYWKINVNIEKLFILGFTVLALIIWVI